MPAPDCRCPDSPRICRAGRSRRRFPCKRGPSLHLRRARPRRPASPWSSPAARPGPAVPHERRQRKGHHGRPL